MRRLVKILAYFLLLGLIIEVSWVLAANHYLRSAAFRRMLSEGSTPVSFESATSPYPGVIHVEGFALKNTETSLELAEVQLNISLLALAAKKLVFWSVDGRNGNLRYTPSDRPTPKDQGAWPIYFKSLRVKELHTLVIGDFSAQGPMQLNVDLKIEGPDRISASGRIKASDTQMNWRNKPAAKVVQLEGNFSMEPLDKKADFLRKLSFDLRADAALTGGDALQGLVVDAPWLKIHGLDLSGQGRIVVQKGLLAPKTDWKMTANQLQVDLWQEKLEGAGSLNIAVIEDELSIDLNLPQFALADVKGTGLDLKLRSKDRDLLSRDRPWHAALHLDQARVRNLAYFNHFLPQGIGLKFKGGEGLLQLHLDSQSTTGNRLTLQSSNALVAFDKQEFSGDLNQDLRLGAIDFNEQRFAIQSGTLGLQIKTPEPWDGQLALDKGRVLIKSPALIEAHVRLKAQDLRPLLWIYDPKSKLPDWARRLFKQESLGSEFNFKATEDGFAIDGLQAKTQDLSVDAWYHEQEKKKRGKLFVRYGNLSAGLGVVDDSIKIQLLSARDWFKSTKF